MTESNYTSHTILMIALTTLNKQGHITDQTLSYLDGRIEDLIYTLENRRNTLASEYREIRDERERVINLLFESDVVPAGLTMVEGVQKLLDWVAELEDQGNELSETRDNF